MSTEFSERRKQLEPYFSDYVTNVYSVIETEHKVHFEQGKYEEFDDYLKRRLDFNEFIKSYLEKLDDKEYCFYFDAFAEDNWDEEESLAESIWEAFKCDDYDYVGLYMDDKGNLYNNAAEYCEAYGLPLMTADQLAETGDLIGF